MLALMKNACKIAVVLIVLLHLASIFVSDISLSVLFAAAFLLLISGFPLQGGGFKKVTLSFLLFGGAILAYYRIQPECWLRSFVSMSNVIAIVAVMQLFTLPIELGRYSKTIEYWLKKSFKKESSLFFFSMAVTHVFSSFLLFGTVPVMVSLFSEALKDNIPNYQRFLASAIVRGYGMALFWTPGAVIMLLVMQVAGVSWFELFVPGLLLSMLGMTTAYVLEHMTRLNKPIATTAAVSAKLPEQAALANRQSVHIVLVVLGLIVSTSVFDLLSIGSGSGRILLAGLLVAGLWLLYYRNHSQLRNCVKQYWETGLLKAVDLSVLFIAMGLFAGAMDYSGLLIKAQPMLQNMVNQSGLVSLFVVFLGYICLAIAGIHPFILVVIPGKILMGLSLPVGPVAIALLLLLVSSISFILSPFAGMVLMTAKFLNVKPVEVALKWNIGFCILFLTEGVIFAFLWK